MKPAPSPVLYRQLFALLWLTIVWVLLWGTFSPANFITGILIALVITTLFRLPPIEANLGVHPIGIAKFILYLAREIVVASLQVSRAALRPDQSTLRNAVIGVQLRSSSLLIITTTAGTIGLIPGSVVIEVDHDNRTLYAHTLDVSSDEDIVQFRERVLELESRIIAALGTNDRTEPTEAK
jgi:multicomponent Na+:H+ antiporter subunit E